MPKFKNSNTTYWVIFKQCDAKNKTFLALKIQILTIVHPLIIKKKFKKMHFIIGKFIHGWKGFKAF